MSHAPFGHTRRILGFALVCAALSFGSTARAQVAPTVDDPFLTDPCVNPLDVTDGLVNPTGFYAGAPNCKALCKKAEADCRQFVNTAAACERADVANIASYDKKNCDVEHADDNPGKKTCKTEAEHTAGDNRSGVSADRSAALDACDKWEQACESSCPHP